MQYAMTAKEEDQYNVELQDVSMDTTKLSHLNSVFTVVEQEFALKQFKHSPSQNRVLNGSRFPSLR
jgi:hypothetical protein